MWKTIMFSFYTFIFLIFMCIHTHTLLYLAMYFFLWKMIIFYFSILVVMIRECEECLCVWKNVCVHRKRKVLFPYLYYAKKNFSIYTNIRNNILSYQKMYTHHTIEWVHIARIAIFFAKFSIIIYGVEVCVWVGKIIIKRKTFFFVYV